jgi:NAD(P)-dependent dehydrogenase (short-subunit alcohol dehydrogenase family)
MISNLEEMIGVVTGANKGIGFECCNSEYIKSFEF